MFATLPKTEINDDSEEPIIETKNEFLNDYLVDGNFDIECDAPDDAELEDAQSIGKSIR